MQLCVDLRVETSFFAGNTSRNPVSIKKVTLESALAWAFLPRRLGLLIIVGEVAGDDHFLFVVRPMTSWFRNYETRNTQTSAPKPKNSSH